MKKSMSAQNVMPHIRNKRKNTTTKYSLPGYHHFLHFTYVYISYTSDSSVFTVEPSYSRHSAVFSLLYISVSVVSGTSPTVPAAQSLVPEPAARAAVNPDVPSSSPLSSEVLRFFLNLLRAIDPAANIMMNAPRTDHPEISSPRIVNDQMKAKITSI